MSDPGLFALPTFVPGEEALAEDMNQVSVGAQGAIDTNVIQDGRLDALESGGIGGEHVLTGDPVTPPVELSGGQLLWDGIPGGGGDPVDHGDLTGVTPDQHHTRYTDAEAVAAQTPAFVGFAANTADVEIVSASSAAPTYLSGCYLFARAEPMIRTAIVNAAFGVDWQAGGEVAERFVYGQVAYRFGQVDPWIFEAAPFCYMPAPGVAVVGTMQYPGQMVLDIPANTVVEFRLYASKNGGSVNHALNGRSYMNLLITPDAR